MPRLRQKKDIRGGDGDFPLCGLENEVARVVDGFKSARGFLARGAAVITSPSLAARDSHNSRMGAKP